ncbi:hypothetical protein [Actinomadura rupiterrae]|uniref:hypothetical protein n=1 Tax=Actinomadura rupiterrae TaxID=559627 RepID=UPI0020A44523|nr:hypothetical protein [Actinomadura rupiterrae]MCP2342986.1 hypothetical protein [Actinomadura rupiterrae]
MESRHNNYLLVVGDREGLAWILKEGRMLLPSKRNRAAGDIRSGDRILIYTSRGCFRNPTRDRGRVIAEVIATSDVAILADELKVAGKIFNRSCSFSIGKMAREGEGVDLAQHVAKLNTFPDKWHTHIRRTIVPISGQDRDLLMDALERIAIPAEEALPSYISRMQNRRKRPV